MGRDRFELIQRYIHFNANNKDKRKQNENRDRVFKTGSLFETLEQNCLSQEHEEYNSKDEQIITFKGGNFLQRFMTTSSMNRRFKFFSKNGISGMCYDFELERTPHPARKEEQVEALGYQLFWSQCCYGTLFMVTKAKGIKLFFDNSFTLLNYKLN